MVLEPVIGYGIWQASAIATGCVFIAFTFHKTCLKLWLKLKTCITDALARYSKVEVFKFLLYCGNPLRNVLGKNGWKLLFKSIFLCVWTLIVGGIWYCLNKEIIENDNCL